MFRCKVLPQVQEPRQTSSPKVREERIECDQIPNPRLTNISCSGKQPQLLPKPTSSSGQTSPASRPLAKQSVQYSTSLGQPIMTAVPGLPISAPSTSQPTQYLLNSSGQIINGLGAQQQQVFMAMGGGQVLAPSASQPAPLLIQQPGGIQGQQQMIVLRPGGPNMQTLVPMAPVQGVQGVQGVPSV